LKGIQAFYDRSARALERRKLGCDIDVEETRSILSSLPPKSASLLDIGCGTGHLLDEAKMRLKVGVDFSRGMLSLARERGCTSALILADATRLPFNDSSFELITSQDVIGHFKDPRRLVREALRVCTPGGMVIVTAARKTLVNRLVSLYSRLRLGVFVRPYEERELEKIFEFSGGHVVSTETVRGSVVKILVTPCEQVWDPLAGHTRNKPKDIQGRGSA